MVELDVKRFYIEALEADCPICDECCEKEYLSYPQVGEPFQETFVCHDCEEEFEKTLLLNIKLEIT